MRRRICLLMMAAFILVPLTVPPAVAQQKSTDPVLLAQGNAETGTRDAKQETGAKEKNSTNPSARNLPFAQYIAVGIATAVILVVVCTPSQKL